MTIKGVDFATLELNTQTIRDQTHPKPERAEKPKEEKPVASDFVDVHKPDKKAEGSSPPTVDLPHAGNQYRYSVDAQHEVVVKVHDMETRREVKQIPSKGYQAFKRAYNKVIARFIDRKA